MKKFRLNLQLEAFIFILFAFIYFLILLVAFISWYCECFNLICLSSSSFHPTLSFQVCQFCMKFNSPGFSFFWCATICYQGAWQFIARLSCCACFNRMELCFKFYFFNTRNFEGVLISIFLLLVLSLKSLGFFCFFYSDFIFIYLFFCSYKFAYSNKTLKYRETLIFHFYSLSLLIFLSRFQDFYE